MIRRLLPLLLLALWATPASAQLGSVPHVFASGDTILASEVNTNFSTAYANACNRTGCTMTGLLTSQQLTPAATNTYDLATTGTRFRDLWLSRDAVIGRDIAVSGSISDPDSVVNVADQFNVTSTTGPQAQVRYDSSNYLEWTVASNGATTLNIAGAGQALAISDPVTVTGTLTATSLVGAIAETSITDGALLARVASTETISGAWTFAEANGVVAANTEPYVQFNETDGSVNEKRWRFLAGNDGFQLQVVNDAQSAATSVFTVGRSAIVVDSFAINATATYVQAGLVGTPGLAFDGDIDTGIYRIGANELGISIGGSKTLGFATAAGSHTILPGIDATGGVGTTFGSTAVRFRATVYSDGVNAADGVQFYESAGSIGRVQFDNGAMLLSTQAGSVSISSLGEVLPSGTAGSFVLPELTSSSTGSLSVSAQARIYVKGDQLIVQFNDAGTMRYKWISLAGTSVTWTHQTTEP
jgi:hypothetical protein